MQRLKLEPAMSILYKDLKGGLSLYKVDQIKGPDSFSIRQDSGNCRDKLRSPKHFDSSFKDKNGRVRLFPLWMEFQKLYIYQKGTQEFLVRFSSYQYIKDEIQFDFIDVKTKTMYTLNFKDCCEKIKFNIHGRE